MQTHDDSIPRDTRSYISKTDESPHFSTSTRYALPTCEASEDGIECQSEANHVYPTSEGIERHLCDAHFYKLLRLIYAWHLIRREMRGAA